MSTTEILDNLQDNARRLKLGLKLPDADPIPWPVIEQVQRNLAEFLDQPGVTMVAISRASGLEGQRPIGRWTLRSFLKYTCREDHPTGTLDRVVRRINGFMELMAQRESRRLPEGFVETKVAERMLLIIEKSTQLCSMAVIVGDSGRGKSLTVEAAKGIYPGTITLRISQSCRTPQGFTHALASALGFGWSGSSREAHYRVVRALAGTGRPIIIDEAHQLRIEALESVRDIYDETGCPIILVGTARITEMIDDQSFFAGQFASRIALRYDITEALRISGPDGPGPLHSVEEIRSLYHSSKVRLTSDGVSQLAKLANLPGLGGLRLCTRLVQVASAAAGGKPITAALIRQVLRTMQGHTYTRERFEADTARPAVRLA